MNWLWSLVHTSSADFSLEILLLFLLWMAMEWNFFVYLSFQPINPRPYATLHLLLPQTFYFLFKNLYPFSSKASLELLMMFWISCLGKLNWQWELEKLFLLHLAKATETAHSFFTKNSISKVQKCHTSLTTSFHSPSSSQKARDFLLISRSADGESNIGL